MSVWESRDSLWDCVYRSGHLDVLRHRAEWFELPKKAFQVMWWIPAGHVPIVEEAVERLELLRAHGPSTSAFGFRDQYTAADDRPMTSGSEESRRAVAGERRAQAGGIDTLGQ